MTKLKTDWYSHSAFRRAALVRLPALSAILSNWDSPTVGFLDIAQKESV
jgi:hypothetical protein